VVVSASDGVSTDTQVLAISVGNVDEPLVITSNGGGASAAISVEEGGVVVTNVAASDPEGATVTYAISGGADAARFAVDPTTGEIRFIEAPDFEAPADQDGDNVYEVTVAAQDGSSLDTQALSVTVTDVNERPIVSGGTSLALTLPENGTAVTTIVASDPDGDPIVYALEGDDAALFVIDPQTGVLSFASAPDFEAPQDLGNDNFYSVRVTASDGVLSAFQTVQISVENVNEGVTITSGSSFATDENATLVGSVAASDGDGDAITYSLSGGADAALFTLDSQTGLLSFVNAPDFESPADADGDNVYELIVTASDGSLLDTQALSVAVNNLRDGLNLLGTAKADTLLGSAAEDSIGGLAGNDKLFGYAGSDFLDGGDGNDRITGGTGADNLTGGAGADTFIYSAVNESSASWMDTITDFSRAQRDTISLAAIDANGLVDGDQAFTFVGAAEFSHRAGELRSYQSEGHTYVSGDVDGDGVGDFLIGLTSAVVLASGDFVL
jgi:Ca2+-binding RTX toxin-like protein